MKKSFGLVCCLILTERMYVPDKKQIANIIFIPGILLACFEFKRVMVGSCPDSLELNGDGMKIL